MSAINFKWNDHECKIVFMPPTSKKLRGHIGLGLSVESSGVQSVMRE